MNILFVVPYVPSLIRVRPYQLIRHLSAAGHQVHVMTLWTSAEEEKAAAQLSEACHEVQAIHLPRWQSYLNVLKTLPTRTPLQAAYCWQPALAEEIVRRLHPSNGRPTFDVIHLEHLRGARFGLALKQRLAHAPRPAPPIVWDSVDSISHLFRQAASRGKRLYDRLLTWSELGRTERFEAWLTGQFDHVLVTSNPDRQALLALAEKFNQTRPAPISVLRNGVDLEYFCPNPEIKRHPATLVLTGKMSYHANVTMALHLVQEIMPLVWQRRADVRVQIVGKDPPRTLQALAEAPRVEVTGTVPALNQYLQKATIAVAPIAYGAGIQNKILEAMSCATPVITSQNAVSDLPVIPEKHLLVAHDPPSFAQAILTLLDDPNLQQRIGRAGREYVEQHHQWREIASQLGQIYTQVRRG